METATVFQKVRAWASAVEQMVRDGSSKGGVDRVFAELDEEAGRCLDKDQSRSMSESARNTCSLRGQVGSWGWGVARGPEFNPQIHRIKATGNHRAEFSLGKRSEWN